MKDFRKIQNKPGVYIIININSRKIYIGSSKDVRARLREHYRQLYKKNHYNKSLQKAFDKDGEDSFQFRVLEFVDDKQKLTKVEEKWIWHFLEEKRKLYNAVYYPTKTTLGFRLTEEQKEKQRGINSPWYGRKHTLEARRKISEANKGIPKDGIYKSIEFRQKISVKTKGELNGNYGHKWSEEKKKALCDYFKKTRDFTGDKNPNCKLKKENLQKICDLYYNKKWSMKKIGQHFQVSKGTMTKFFKENNLQKRNKIKNETCRNS